MVETGNRIADLGFDDAMQESMEWEQLSNASVYHANFEKIKVSFLNVISLHTIISYTHLECSLCFIEEM